jgi:hypothetical protein
MLAAIADAVLECFRFAGQCVLDRVGRPMRSRRPVPMESDEFFAAAKQYDKARLLVEVYSALRHKSAWAEDQYQMWLEVVRVNSWVEPGR